MNAGDATGYSCIHGRLALVIQVEIIDVLLTLTRQSERQIPGKASIVKQKGMLIHGRMTLVEPNW